ncbi:Putative protein-glutamate O-methyltransferase [Gryllus bimaculatus]|nr:Putative protein-glutamate O-methyltransferase [Gryllus bimaculatus]
MGSKLGGWWTGVKEVELRNQRFIVDQPPPFNTHMMAKWKQTYAYVTVMMRMAVILDMTLDQFKMDMEAVLQEEMLAAQEEAAKEKCPGSGEHSGQSSADHSAKHSADKPKRGRNPICDALRFKCPGPLKHDDVASVQLEDLEAPPDLPPADVCPLKKRIRWTCVPPPLSMDEIDMAVGNSLEMEIQQNVNTLNTEWTPKYCYGTRKMEKDSFECFFGQLKIAKRKEKEAAKGHADCNEKKCPHHSEGHHVDAPCPDKTCPMHNKQKSADGRQSEEDEIPPCDPRRKEKPKDVEWVVFGKKPAESEESLVDVDDPRFDEWCHVEKSLMQLKDEVQTNAWWQKLHDDLPDVQEWNKFLKERSRQDNVPKLRWISTIWIYAECYLFRRIHQIFRLTESVKDYDPFRRMKIKSLLQLLDGMHMAASDFYRVIDPQNNPTIKNRDAPEYLKMFLSLSLWGNRTDLLKGGPTSPMTDFTGGNPLIRVLTFSPSILVNEMDVVWQLLTSKDVGAEVRVDIVTDNAGFELFADFLLADFLVTYRLAATVHFHVKSRKKSVPLAKLAERWYDYLACGIFVLKADYFWTLPFDYNDMRCSMAGAPLYSDLIYSTLIIFKGDLNYRKLVGDINWDPLTPFKLALRSFRPTNIIAMRTYKSDVSCGVPEYAYLFYPGMPKSWMLTGKVALVQYAQKRHCVPGLPHPP